MFAEIEPLHVATVAGAVISLALSWLLWRRRIAGPSRFQHESQHIVCVTEDEVSCKHLDNKIEMMTWDDFHRFEVITTSDGPLAPDVFWILLGSEKECVIPQGATGTKELLERLVKLPSFDNEKFIKAMGCTGERTFICWKKQVAKW